jgi:hypothetical protein
MIASKDSTTGNRMTCSESDGANADRGQLILHEHSDSVQSTKSDILVEAVEHMTGKGESVREIHFFAGLGYSRFVETTCLRFRWIIPMHLRDVYKCRFCSRL